MSILAVKAKIDGFSSFDEFSELVVKFESCTLPRPHWTHRAHLSVACWYLICYPVNEAMWRIREGIKRYNHSQGIVTSKDTGYHETMTVFWVRMVHAYLSKSTLECSIVNLVNDMVFEYSNKNLPFEYYSRERLLSVQARADFIEPDLKPLP